MSKLEQHHIRYEEIHGEDEIILLSREEHRKVHREDQANGFKPIPDWIVKAAKSRSPGRKAAQAEYEKSDAGKVTIAKYRGSEKGKIAGKAGTARHAQSKKGKVARARYDQSEKGKAANRAADARYRAKQKELRT